MDYLDALSIPELLEIMEETDKMIKEDKKEIDRIKNGR